MEQQILRLICFFPHMEFNNKTIKHMKSKIIILTAFALAFSLLSCQKAHWEEGCGVFVQTPLYLNNQSGQDIVLEYKGKQHSVAQGDTTKLDSVIFSQLVYWKTTDSAIFSYGDSKVIHTRTYIESMDTAVYSPEENNFFDPIYWELNVSYRNMTYTILPTDTAKQ